MSDRTIEWVSAKHSPTNTTVTVSVTDTEARVSAKWTVKTYASAIGEAVPVAREGARKALAELREALS